MEPTTSPPLEIPHIPDEAIADLVHFNQFIHTLPSDPTILHSIASTLQRRFESSRDIMLIDCAIVAYDRATDLTQPKDTAYVSRVCDATVAFISPFDDPTFAGRRARLEASDLEISKRIATMNTLLAVVDDDGHPLAPTIHQSLANLYYATFELSKNVEDLSRCICSFEQAVCLIQPRGGKEHQHYVFLLSACLLQRFHLAGDISNYSTIIMYRQELLDVLPSDEVERRATILEQQAATFASRSVATGSVEDRASSIDLQRRSLTLTPRDTEDYPRRLWDLSALCSARALRTKSVADADEAIVYAREAVDLTTIPSHRPGRLSQLAYLLSIRASLTRDTTDMSNAIELHREATRDVTPTHPRYATMLTLLGTSFMIRYGWTQTTADLSYAISAYEEALKYDNRGRAYALERLAKHLTLRFQHNQHTSQSDIDKAISTLEQSIDLTPPGDPNFPSRWDALAFALSLRFGLTANPDDINNAIYFAGKALSSTPENDAQRPRRIFTLCNCLSDRFDSSLPRLGKDRKDLDRAIALGKECMSSPCLGPSYELPMKTLLAILLARRYTLDGPGGQQEDISKALQYFTESATDPTVDPTSRMTNATFLCQYAQDAAQTLQACALAISLHHECASLERTIEERYTVLETAKATLARNSASFALKYGEVELAVDWLEQARCLVWTQLDWFQPAPADLATTHPELAKELEMVGTELKAAGSRTRRTVQDGGDVLEVVKDEETIPLLRKHMELVQAWDSVLARIRESQGFSSFLKPMKIHEYLENAPKEGPVVILTASMTRADAISLVAGKGLVHIPLRNLNVVRVQEMAQAVRTWLQRNGVRTRNAKRGMRFESDEGAIGLRSTLADLWVLVVEPVLISLGYSPIEDPESRPRIWWCPAGSFGFLPIHAAGIYGADSSLGTCVSDYAISSYTPNITTLLKKQATPHTARPNSLLLVSQPATPDLPPIPATKQEADELDLAMHAAGIPVQSFTDEHATIEAIKHGLTESTWAHFACHAVQDVKAPLQSGLYLHDGRLELSSMMEYLPNEEHAFLSACQTSTGHEELKEEAVHIAAGMLAAGYRGVVGTMWSIADSYGPIVAKEFYGYLLRKAESDDVGIPARLDALRLGDDAVHPETKGVGGIGPGLSARRMDCTLSARALHLAVQQLRGEVGDSEDGLLAWVPYVHFGV